MVSNVGHTVNVVTSWSRVVQVSPPKAFIYVYSPPYVPLETNTASLAWNTVCEPLVYLTRRIAPPLHKQLPLEAAEREDKQEHTVAVLARRNASTYLAVSETRVIRIGRWAPSLRHRPGCAVGPGVPTSNRTLWETQRILSVHYMDSVKRYGSTYITSCTDNGVKGRSPAATRF
jgi:hypothetical protein